MTTISQIRQLIREEIMQLLSEVSVVTREYESSHGKKPSGTGAWAFRLENDPNGKNGDVVWLQGTLKYSDAVKKATEKAKLAGKKFAIVMP